MPTASPACAHASTYSSMPLYRLSLNAIFHNLAKHHCYHSHARGFNQSVVALYPLPMHPISVEKCIQIGRISYPLLISPPSASLPAPPLQDEPLDRATAAFQDHVSERIER